MTDDDVDLDFPLKSPLVFRKEVKMSSFRVCLYQIGEQISRMSLDNLKFVCQLSGEVSVARIEQVHTATDLFSALEEKGNLSSTYLEFLAQLLNSIGQKKLIQVLRNKGFRVPEPIPPSGSIDFLYAECLLKIAMQLSSPDVDKLIFILKDPHLQISREQVFTATQLFKLLHQRQVVSPRDLKVLYQSLEDIGHADCCNYIKEYYRRTNQVLPVSAPAHQIQDHFQPHQGSPGNQGHMPGHQVPVQESGDTTPMFQQSQYSSLSTMSSRTSSSSFATSDTTLTPSLDHGSQSIEPGGLQMMPTYLQQGSKYSEIHLESIPPEPLSTRELGYRRQAYGLYIEANPGDPPSLSKGGEVANLINQLGQKTSELREREEEIDRLKNELGEAQQRTDSLIQERVGEVEVYAKSIRELEDMLRNKNGEVQGLLVDLESLHNQMATVQAANSSFNTDDLYQMNRSPHGLCIIINNHKFFHHTDPEKAHTERGGAKIDEYNLIQTFRYLHYKVELHENLTSRQMTELMMATSQRDHSMYDSFICCILTHGEKDMVHGADSESVNLLDLAGLIKYSSSLRGKPKMFFIQACRGDVEDQGFQDVQRDAPQDIDISKPSIPQETDFFFGYATPQGNSAYRSRRHGSWYISELCKVLTQHAYTHNLSSMMKKVNFQVSKAFTKDGHKQAPEFVDRLRKEVDFFYFSKIRKQRELAAAGQAQLQ